MMFFDDLDNTNVGSAMGNPSLSKFSKLKDVYDTYRDKEESLKEEEKLKREFAAILDGQFKAR